MLAEQLTAYYNLNLNEVTTITYHNSMENLLEDNDQNQNNSRNLKQLRMESSGVNYDNMSTPVPIVAKFWVGDAISNNLIPIHAEYEDKLIREEYDV